MTSIIASNINISSFSDNQLRDEIRLREGKVTNKAKRPYLERYIQVLLGLQPKLESVLKKKKVQLVRPIPVRATASEEPVRAPMRASVVPALNPVTSPVDDVYTNVFGFSPIATIMRVD